MKHPALIFDFGNVIAHFDFARATARLGAPRGLSGDALLDQLNRAGWVELHHQYEHGRLSTEDFATAWMALAEIEAVPEEFQAAWSDIFTPNESIVPVVASLHEQGYSLVLGSNTNALHASHFRAQYRSTLDHFDALILSFEIGHMKPSREFYLACARAAGRPPADCLFIDDLSANVTGACDAGMNALLYTNTPTLITDLARVGIAT